MRIYVLTTALLLSCNALLFAQDTKQTNPDVIRESEKLDQLGNNEIKLNIPSSILGLPEISYERFLEDNMGIGLTIGVGADKPEKMPIRFQAIPHYRIYFGKKKANGFFIEGNMAVVSYHRLETYEEYDFTTQTYITKTIDEKSTSFGMGAAIGVKLLTRNGFVGEIYSGGGRLFGNSLVGGFFRGGICIGRRY